MTPLIATVLCFALIGYLFWADRESTHDVSAAVWIPLLWMFFAASRFPAQWWNLGPPVAETFDITDGSPMDRNVFLVLIVAALFVLARRQISWLTLAKNNLWILLFFSFALLSCVWSDEPFVAFKRWTKALGSVAMALVLLTEKRPFEALGVVLRRLAFVLLPLSVLFIKYYPDLGREYHMGIAMYTGAAFQKNSLGQLCMLVTIYFAWIMLLRRWDPAESIYRPRPAIGLIVGAMLVWLLYMAQSATAFAVIGVVTVMFALSSRRVFAEHPNRLVAFGILLAVVVPLLEYSLNLSDAIIRLLGREPDLTERVPLWGLVLQAVPNAWIGAGYESFWLGDRVFRIWAELGLDGGGFRQAHNGYIELYANLGLIGLAFLLFAILFGLLKARAKLHEEYPYAVLRLALICMALLYNYTEAAFISLHNVFVLLLFSIIAVPVPGTVVARSRRPAQRVPPPKPLPSFAGGAAAPNESAPRPSSAWAKRSPQRGFRGAVKIPR